MMVVVSGRFNTYLRIDGKIMPVETLLPGDLFGEGAVLIEERTRPVTVEAAEDSEVIFMSNYDIDKMLKNNKKLAAQFAYNMVGILSYHLRHNTTRLYG